MVRASAPARPKQKNSARNTSLFFSANTHRPKSCCCKGTTASRCGLALGIACDRGFRGHVRMRPRAPKSILEARYAHRKVSRPSIRSSHPDPPRHDHRSHRIARGASGEWLSRCRCAAGWRCLRCLHSSGATQLARPRQSDLRKILCVLTVSHPGHLSERRSSTAHCRAACPLRQEGTFVRLKCRRRPVAALLLQRDVRLFNAPVVRACYPSCLNSSRVLAPLHVCQLS